MKYNVISILVDSVSWDCISTHRTKVSVTPFLDKLRKESIFASKLYSQGPYTDAATKSLYTGRDCLDDFAYYSKLNSSPSNHYKVFHDNGYETIGFYYPYYMIGTGIKKYIDHSIYTSGFVFGSEWGGIFSYYSEAKKIRKVTQDEYLLLTDHFALLFDVWTLFYQELISNPLSATIIKDNIGTFDIYNALSVLQEEERKFKESSKSYIDDFLDKGKNHILFTLDGINVDATIPRENLLQLFQEKDSFFKKVQLNNFRANWWRNRPGLLRIFKGGLRYLKYGDKNSLKFIKNYFLLLQTITGLKNRSLLPLWQYLPSAKKEFQGAIDILRQRQVAKPFYLSLHVLDPHSFINFFSYDMVTEQDVMKEEFDLMEGFVDNLGSDFIGDLPYFLSLRYSDYCLEQFCTSLRELGLWDNTVLLIFADHGSSFSYYPLHNEAVNCFDEECYHVPMFLRIPGIKEKEITSYHNAKDMFPTLFECLGIKKPDSFKGISMLDQTVEDKNYVMTEYMGPGCPDLLSRRAWFSVRDDNYIVAYKVGIWEDFEQGDLCEVYDLKKDPNAYYNLNYVINRDKINYLLLHIKSRHAAVKKEVNDYMSKLRDKQ